MKDEHIVRRTLADRREGRTDWARIDAMTEEEIEANAASDPDAPPLSEEELAAGVLVMPHEHPWKPISVPVDPDVLEHFRKDGPGYQSRINAVLRAYVRTQQRGEARS
jgi:uncharacterized protein (DUF4415 family)